MHNYRNRPIWARMQEMNERLYRIVVADDAANFRMMLALTLGHERDIEIVAEATNGAEAVELCRKHRPDVLLLDISMPVMDGFEAIPHVMDAAPGTAIVMLSAFTGPEVRQQAAALGADEYLEKGTDPAELAQVVRQVAAA